MTFDDIPDGAAVFVDANTLIYHFAADPQFGPACTSLLKRVEQNEISGFTSANALSEVAHRLMTIEAIMLFGWPIAGIAQRLRRHHVEIAKLTRFRQAVDEVPRMGLQVLSVEFPQISAAAAISQQHELLSGDALIVAIIRQHGIKNIASYDTDFDRVAGLTRYATV